MALVGPIAGAGGGAQARPAMTPTGRLARHLEIEQDRWFLWSPVLFGLGVITYFALATEPPLVLALAPFAAAVALAATWRHGSLAAVATGAALAVALGFAAAKLRTEWVAAPVLERQLAGVEVRGFVEAVEAGPARARRITLHVTALGRLEAAERPRRVRIRLLAGEPLLAPGDAVRLKATLAPPALPAFPGDHDFARAAWFDGLGAVGYAVARPVLDSEAGQPPFALRIAAGVERLRQAIGERVRAVLPGERGAIATALITGERGGISAATSDAFRDSGLFHMLSISGLHMAIMAGAVFHAVRLALAAVPVFALRYPIKKWAAAVAIAGAFGYLLISGAAIATIRSWIMITIMFAAVMLDRPAIALRNVALAALVILAFAPESLFDAGFQMSFAAVVALVSAYEFVREREAARARGLARGTIASLARFFLGIVLSTVIASLAVAPFGAYHFHETQQFAVLANLIAIPICNVLVMPAALASLLLMATGLEAAPLRLMGLGIDAVVWCAYAVGGLPGAVSRIPAFSVLAFGLMIAGGLWLCLWRTRWRLLGLAAVAAGIALAPFLRRPDVVVGNDAQLVAVRADDGRLWTLLASRSLFEMERWLERDGDGRRARQAARTDQVRCDALGCTATVKGRLVAAARHPGALADDCVRAGILVLAFPAPRACRPRGPVIDFFAVRREGTHALYIGERSIEVETVAAARGSRPWTRASAGPRPPERQPPARTSRLPGFVPPVDLAPGPAGSRPELEEEDLADAPDADEDPGERR